MGKRVTTAEQGALLIALALMLPLTSGCSKKDEPRDAASPVQGIPRPSDNSLLQVGEPAPNFQGVAHSGQKVSLAELRGKVVVLYFYPKDGTPGCVAEAKGFRDEYQNIDKAGAVVIGVSTQDNESHSAFAKKYNLPFLLLPDEDAKIAKAYGVGSVLGFTKRVTFVIDRDGIIARVYESVSPPGHASEILVDLNDLGPGKAEPVEASTDPSPSPAN